ncbi:MAG: hypothetical protein J5J00_14160 [Deltaproteobacteria bacterium]|nr:hypothetical protein [Deltaproteobacteria bacterium]
MLRIFHAFLFGSVLAAALAGGTAPAEAEFIQTGPSVFQASEDLRAKVVGTSVGVFVLYAAEPIPLQQFSPDSIKLEGSYSAFITYDAKRNMYSDVVVQSLIYPVRGSFALKVGELSVKVDNNASPYLTVVVGSETKNPSIVPFSSTTPFGVYTGAGAVGILEANQAFSHIKDISPYIVTVDGALNLKGNRVSGHVGLAIPQGQNDCLISGALFIEHHVLEKIKAVKDAAKQREQLQAAVAAAKRSRPFSDIIILSVDSEQHKVIAFDPRDSSVLAIKPVGSGNSDRQICEVEKIRL